MSNIVVDDRKVLAMFAEMDKRTVTGCLGQHSGNQQAFLYDRRRRTSDLSKQAAEG